MKAKILEALQKKFSDVSASMLEPTAKKLAKTTTKEEDVATSVEGVTIQQVIESYSDFRANQASETAGKNAVAAYEKQHGLKDGTKIDEKGGAPAPKPNSTNKTDKTNEEEPEWAKQMRKRQEQILKRYADEDAAKTQGELGGKLVSLLKEKGVRESFYGPAIKGRTFKDEAEVTAYADELAKSFEDDNQAVANGKTGQTPHASQGSASGEDDPLLKSVQDKTAEMAKAKEQK